MHSDLEAIVAADEEARSRVTLAESRRERDLRAARELCDAAVQRKRSEVEARLDAELAGITGDGDARIDAVRAQQQVSLAMLHDTGERRFDEAVEAWLRIVGEIGEQS